MDYCQTWIIRPVKRKKQWLHILCQSQLKPLSAFKQVFLSVAAHYNTIKLFSQMPTLLRTSLQIELGCATFRKMHNFGSLYFCTCNECQKRDMWQTEKEKEWLCSCRWVWLIWQYMWHRCWASQNEDKPEGFCPMAIIITDSLIQSVTPIMPTRRLDWTFQLPPFVTIIHSSIFFSNLCEVFHHIVSLCDVKIL